jgi:hypothetical protein
MKKSLKNFCKGKKSSKKITSEEEEIFIEDDIPGENNKIFRYVEKLLEFPCDYIKLLPNMYSSFDCEASPFIGRLRSETSTIFNEKNPGNSLESKKGFPLNGKKQLKRLKRIIPRNQRGFLCGCGKDYASYPALYLHVKIKHPGSRLLRSTVKMEEGMVKDFE